MLFRSSDLFEPAVVFSLQRACGAVVEAGDDGREEARGLTGVLPTLFIEGTEARLMERRGQALGETEREIRGGGWRETFEGKYGGRC